MLVKNNIYVDQSTDFKYRIDNLIDTTEDLETISTYDYFSSIKKVYSSAVVAKFDVEKSNTEISLLLSDIDSVDLDPGKYQYDVLMRNGDGVINKVVEGLVFIIPTMTVISTGNTDTSNTDTGNTSIP